MHKKIIGALMALAAFAAFAVMPATSSASPVLTHPTGTPMGACTGCIKATNITAPLLVGTAGGTLVTCSTATLTGNLEKNTGTEIAGTITSASYTGSGVNGECTSEFGNLTVTPQVSAKAPWCLKSTGGDKWSVTGGDCPGGGRLKFTLDSTTIGECEYESTAAGVAGEFTTHPEDAVLHVTESGFSKIRGSLLCPSSGHLSQSFTLETDTVEKDPLYIS